ncbi:phosphohistidine phosphatase SixA [PVC group bacterium (ex Bugula neritina AB1)]|nr:phosphohistidine phosphatase SixA [PVC group bacterium (ex Bugula neritina AB1)]
MVKNISIYVMRHGEADYSSKEGERVLTQEGEERICRWGRFCDVNKVDCQSIWHSPLKRAVQTASLMKDSLGVSSDQLEVKDFLSPDGDLDLILRELEVLDTSTLLVSHLPLVDILVARLLFGREREAFHYRVGAVIALERMYERWYLNWMLHPEMLI